MPHSPRKNPKQKTICNKFNTLKKSHLKNRISVNISYGRSGVLLKLEFFDGARAEGT